jgi:hypothetical protein
MSACPSTGCEAVECDEVGVRGCSRFIKKIAIVMKIKPRKGASSSSGCVGLFLRVRNSYLVDPASSHMLVSKIKPCMSKYKQICTVKLRMAH